MHIQREQNNTYAVQSYTENEVKVNSLIYEQSLIIHAEGVISPWLIHTLKELDVAHLEALVSLRPEVILLGHQEGATIQAPIALYGQLATQGIGLECMSIGAACRTFNVLLSEGRKVVLGLIFKA
jgi:uncharacterized protein